MDIDEYLIQRVALKQQMLAGDRAQLLAVLHFLLTDSDTHKKRAYLAPFLTPVDVPVEYQQDESRSEP